MTSRSLTILAGARFLECDCGQITYTVEAMSRHKSESGCPWTGTPEEAAAFLAGIYTPSRAVWA